MRHRNRTILRTLVLRHLACHLEHTLEPVEKPLRPLLPVSQRRMHALKRQVQQLVECVDTLPRCHRTERNLLLDGSFLDDLAADSGLVAGTPCAAATPFPRS